MNPLTLLFLASCAWIAVLGVNNVWFSLLVAVISAVVAWRRIWAVLGLGLPLFLSLLVIHVPSGNWDVAVSLGLRGVALIAVLLGVSSWIRIDELAKALQGIGLSPRVTYVIGTALNMLPMARRYATAYSGTARGLGRIKYVAFPLITRMLVHSAGRQLPLQTSGVLLPGRRTVLRPVPFRVLDWAVCGLAVIGVGVVLGVGW